MSCLYDDAGWDAVQEALEALTPPDAATGPETTSLGWASIPVERGTDVQVHVVPIEDVKPHLLAERCACGAREDPVSDGVFLHHAWDRREDYQRGRKLH